jgi:hypothetical protein
MEKNRNKPSTSTGPVELTEEQLDQVTGGALSTETKSGHDTQGQGQGLVTVTSGNGNPPPGQNK